MTYDQMITKIKDKEHFTFSRWGDGELSCALGYQGENCDGHVYFPDLRDRLSDILFGEQRYYLGLQPKAVRDMGVALQVHFSDGNVNFEWTNADIIHDASAEQGLEGLFLAAKGRACLVGPSHLRPLCEKVRWSHIVTPNINAWKAYEHIKSKMLGVNADLTLFCCGMMANVLIDDFWYMFGHKRTYIDVGSALDPYCGIVSRRYHNKIVEREENGKA